MKSAEKASKILQNAEADLRKLIGEAAGDGDYSGVETIAAWASSLHKLSEHAVALPESSNGSKKTAIRTKKTKKKTAKQRGQRNGSYPKFAVSGDTLVKIAWSKAKKGEYKHKSPKSVACVLADTLDRLFAENELVSMETVLPIKDADGNDIPDYQVYLCLAWLKAAGAVNQKGREGYTQSNSKETVQSDLKVAWHNLPKDK